MLSGALSRILLCLIVTMFSGATFAAGYGDGFGTTSKMPTRYQKAMKIIKLSECQEAISLLKLAGIIKPKDADIECLVGFTYLKPEDLEKAGACYREAVKIDRKHKGVLEYQGELSLMVGNKAAAEDHRRS